MVISLLLLRWSRISTSRRVRSSGASEGYKRQALLLGRLLAQTPAVVQVQVPLLHVASSLLPLLHVHLLLAPTAVLLELLLARALALAFFFCEDAVLWWHGATEVLGVECCCPWWCPHLKCNKHHPFHPSIIRSPLITT